MSKLTLLALLISSVVNSDSYKILGIFPSLDRNNHLTYKNLFRELAIRNHDVTLISHFQMVDAPSSYKDIVLSDSPVYKGLSFESVVSSDLVRVPFETLVSTKAGNDDCKTLFNNHHVLHMLRTRPRFDVILVESYNSDCGLALAYNFSAPYISFVPQALQPWQYGRLGITFNPSTVPHSGLPYGKQPWFFERVKNYLLYYVSNVVYYVGSQVPDHVYLYKYLGDTLPTLETIASNTSLVFVNTHRSVFGGVSRSDNVIDVGGIHVRAPRVISTEIERFINEAEYGVIYVSLGSTVKDSTLPKEKLKELVSTFSKLPLRVLWKWDGEGAQNFPNNIMAKRWLPQYDILRHHNVKAFISHAGILSASEAIDTGVPIVAVPLFGDQYGNAAALVDSGIATVVPYEELTKTRLLDAINEVLDPIWQERAKQISRLWHDRPMSPMETAIYWTEYVARYNGAPNMAATSVSVPLYQYLQLDVLGFLGLLTYILYYIVSKMFSLCCSCSRSDDESSVYVEERRNKRVKFE